VIVEAIKLVGEVGAIMSSELVVALIIVLLTEVFPAKSFATA